jgi:hypothetical protein
MKKERTLPIWGSIPSPDRRDVVDLEVRHSEFVKKKTLAPKAKECPSGYVWGKG